MVPATGSGSPAGTAARRPAAVNCPVAISYSEWVTRDGFKTGS
jgi:hypothetical protein